MLLQKANIWACTYGVADLELGILSLLGFLHAFGFPFGPRPPVGIVDGGVLKQSGKHKDEAHDQIDIDGFDVADTGQGRPNSCTNGRHCQHGRNACK